jgi:cyclin-dependent kinase
VWGRARLLLSWAVDVDSDNLIRSVLGTPNEESWPGVKQLPDYKPTFPQWSAQNLAEQVPYLDAAGIDLLKVR